MCSVDDIANMSEHKDVAHSVPQRNMRSIILFVNNNNNNNNIIISNAASVLNTCRIVNVFGITVNNNSETGTV